MLFNCNYYTFWNAKKSQKNEKKHSVSIFVLATLFGKICPRLIFVFPKLPQQKKGNLENISRFPFFYFGNLGKTKIRRGQICPQSGTYKFRNKILFLCSKPKPPPLLASQLTQQKINNFDFVLFLTSVDQKHFIGVML